MSKTREPCLKDGSFGDLDCLEGAHMICIHEGHSISNQPTLLLIEIGRFFFYEINL